MSMTRKEAADIIENKIQIDVRLCTDEEVDQYQDALYMALSALRTPTREMVEKSWVGCGYCEKHKINLVRIEMNYDDSPGSTERLNPTRAPKFCPICGRPLTDEAVDMMLQRWKGAANEH